MAVPYIDRFFDVVYSIYSSFALRFSQLIAELRAAAYFLENWVLHIVLVCVGAIIQKKAKENNKSTSFAMFHVEHLRRRSTWNISIS